MANENDTFINSMNTIVMNSICKNLSVMIEKYVMEFTDRTVDMYGGTTADKAVKKGKIIGIWNDVCKEFQVMKDRKQCEKMISKNGEMVRCKSKSTSKSGGKFCSRHTDKNVVKGECCMILTSHKNKGHQCGKPVSGKSKTGKYCSRHLKKGEEEDKKDSEEENQTDEEEEEIVEKKKTKKVKISKKTEESEESDGEHEEKSEKPKKSKKKDDDPEIQDEKEREHEEEHEEEQKTKTKKVKSSKKMEESEKSDGEKSEKPKNSKKKEDNEPEIQHGDDDDNEISKD